MTMTRRMLRLLNINLSNELSSRIGCTKVDPKGFPFKPWACVAGVCGVDVSLIGLRLIKRTNPGSKSYVSR